MHKGERSAIFLILKTSSFKTIYGGASAFKTPFDGLESIFQQKSISHKRISFCEISSVSLEIRHTDGDFHFRYHMHSTEDFKIKRFKGKDRGFAG